MDLLMGHRNPHIYLISVNLHDLIISLLKHSLELCLEIVLNSACIANAEQIASEAPPPFHALGNLEYSSQYHILACSRPTTMNIKTSKSYIPPISVFKLQKWRKKKQGKTANISTG